MKRVLVDVDGVLADFVGAYLQLLEYHCGIKATHDQVTDWDIAKSLGLTQEQSSRMKRAVGDCAYLARNLEVLHGAVEGVRELEKVADVYIVTSPWNSNPTWTHDRERWLYTNFGIPSKRVIHTSAKYICRGDLFVDDKSSALHDWMAEHDGIAVKWETPHNRRDNWLGPSTNDWAELRELVERSDV